MNTFLNDMRYGARMLMKQPGFALIAVVTLALGIGANTAIFSVVNAVLLNPLPYASPDRLMYVYRMQPPIGRGPVSRPAFFDFESQQKSFDAFAAHYPESVNLTGTAEAERVLGRRVTGHFFEIFGVQPELGRFLTSAEDRAGAERVAVISHGLWQRRFGGDRSIVGKTVRLNGETHTIIGVAPARFQYPRGNDVWLPARLDENQNGRGNNFLLMMGRLKPGVSRETAQTEMNGIAAALAKQYPDNHANLGILVAGLQDEQVRGIRSLLWILLGAVGFVLLIACANVANLLLARAMGRQREFAIRAAMGAPAMRILRQLLTESFLLALLGGGAGVLLAYWGIDLLLALAPANLPRLKEIGIDGRVLGFSLLISLATGLLFGLAPALQFFRADANETLKEGSRGVIGTPSQSWLRRSLVVTEIALSLVLLVSAGLLIGSMRRLLAVNPGFDATHLLTADLSYPSAPPSAYPRTEEGERRRTEDLNRFLRETEERASRIPGVQAAGMINDLPVTGDSSVNGDFSIVGKPAPKPGEAPVAEFRSVTPGYFHAIGIPVLKGRVFDGTETPQTPIRILINEALAKRFFPNEDPIGKRINAADGKPHEIIGVVGSARQWALSLPPDPEIYFCNAQFMFGESISLVLRTNADPAGFSEAVRQIVKSINPEAPVFRVRTMQSVIAVSVSEGRFNTILMSIFAFVALALAAIGLYGVMAYSVSQRTHEIGVRMALGASMGNVLRLVIGQGMALAAAGVFVGLIGSFFLTRLLEGMLFGVSATDPATFLLVALGLTGMALLASWIPARRASRVDPMVALRYE